MNISSKFCDICLKYIRCGIMYIGSIDKYNDFCVCEDCYNKLMEAKIIEIGCEDDE